LNFRVGPTNEASNQPSGKMESRAETPPPTYDEALLVTQSVRLSPEAGNQNQPLFVPLPVCSSVDQDQPKSLAEVDDQPPSYTAVSCSTEA